MAQSNRSVKIEVTISWNPHDEDTISDILEDDGFSGNIPSMLSQCVKTLIAEELPTFGLPENMRISTRIR